MPLKRLFHAWLVLGAASGCWAAQKTEIVLWGIAFGPNLKGFEAVVREFERRNPDVAVRVLSLGAGRMDPQKLLTSIVGNVAPDVILQDRFTIGDWASRGAFQPLDGFIARDKATDPLCPRAEQYYPAVWEEACYKGQVFAIPIAADNRALYWNRGIFREKADALRRAGLDPNRPPRTWSELVAYSKILTERYENGLLKRAGFLPNFGNSWLYIYAYQMGARFMSNDGMRCTMNTPESQEALAFMVKGYDAVGGYEKAMIFQSGFQELQNDAFIRCQVAMKIDGDWILNDLSRYAPDLDFAVAPAPVPDDRYFKRGRFAKEKETYVTWSGGFSYAIPAGAKRPQEAWRFIKWATSIDARILDNQAQKDFERRRGRQFIPKQSANLVANERIFQQFKPADPKFANALRAHIDLMPHARIRPVTFVGQRLWDEQVRATEKACLKVLTPAQALASSEQVVQRELDAVHGAAKYPVLDLRIPLFIFVGLGAIGVAWLAAAYRRARLGKLGRHEARWAYVLVFPWVAGFLIFTLGPMLASIVFSLTQYSVLSPARWVGGQNFAQLFTVDWANVQKAFGNIFYIAGIGVPLNLLTGLAIAMLLNNAVRGMRLYRTFFYMPAIVPTVAASVLWLWLLASDPHKGMLNAAWESTISMWFGTPVPGWLSAESWSKPGLILMGVWGAGGGMILWLAGLKGIPGQLYEAASIDGANSGKQFFSVTLPLLSPIIFFNAVMGLIGSMQEFDRVYVMRTPEGNPGPNDSLLVPVYHLFTNGFAYFKMGYASALAWVIFGLILGLTLIQFRLAPRWVHYEVEK